LEPVQGLMNSETQAELGAARYQQAVEIIRQEWLAEGMTPEEWDRSDRVAELLSREIASGKDAGEILSRWEGLTAEQILASAEAPASTNRSSAQVDGDGKPRCHTT
jgi:hypothetical protein